MIQEFHAKRVRHVTPLQAALRAVFRGSDLDGDGNLDRSQLYAFFQQLRIALTEEALSEMMDEMDTDGDGMVTLQEFTEWVHRLVPALSPPVGQQELSAQEAEQASQASRGRSGKGGKKSRGRSKTPQRKNVHMGVGSRSGPTGKIKGD